MAEYEIRQRKLRRCVAAAILVELLEDDKKREGKRGKTRSWIRRRDQKGTDVRGLMIEDTPSYREMMRMTHEDFIKILELIEPDITRCQVTGGHKVITAAERLTLTIRFLATGETYRSLSFQFRISKSAISYIVNEVCQAIEKNVRSTYFKFPSTHALSSNISIRMSVSSSVHLLVLALFPFRFGVDLSSITFSDISTKASSSFAILKQISACTSPYPWKRTT